MYIGHLKHAVATTTCGETVAMLRRILREAEASLQERELRLNASKPKCSSVQAGGWLSRSAVREEVV